MTAFLAWAGFATLIMLGVLLISTGVSVILDALLWGQDVDHGIAAVLLGLTLLALGLFFGPFTVELKGMT